MLKTLLFNHICKAIPQFMRLIEESKANDSKLISVFKYPNLTFLTSQVFESITSQLLNSIDIIGHQKTLDNLASQYNLSFILSILKANLAALNHCRLNLKDLLRKQSSYEAFLEAFKKTILQIIETGYNQDFQECEEQETMKKLWQEIY